jgi:hypothetical protein
MRTGIKVSVRRAETWEGLELSSYALDELKAAHRGKYSVHSRMYLVSLEEGPMMVVGISPTTLVGTGAEVWLMLCRDATVHLRRYASFLYRGIRHLSRLFGGLRCAVRDDFWAGHKFAKFLGFTPVGDVAATDGSVYVIYELRRGA